MELKDKAKEYAINVLEEHIAQIATAYTNGYMQAYKEIAALPIEENGITYVDLGLPSGTLWSSCQLLQDNTYLKFPCQKASVLQIPTKEQVEELIAFCKIISNKRSNNFSALGKTGNEVLYWNTYIWIKSDPQNDEATVYDLSEQKFEARFMGYQYPIALVKVPKVTA